MKGDKEIYLNKMQKLLDETLDTYAKLNQLVTAGERLHLVDFRIYLKYTKDELDTAIAIIEDEE